MVTDARDRGLPAYAETCPQYLFLSYDNYEEPGFDGEPILRTTPGTAVSQQPIREILRDFDKLYQQGRLKRLKDGRYALNAGASGSER
jgi:hypothetical protein